MLSTSSIAKRWRREVMDNLEVGVLERVGGKLGGDLLGDDETLT